MWSKTPSELLGITNEYEAYCVNEAVWAFGSKVRSEVEEAGKSGSNERIKRGNAENKFRELLGMEKKFAPPPRTN